MQFAPTMNSQNPTGAELTLLRRFGFIGKRFFLNHEGTLAKEAAGNCMDYVACRMAVGNAFVMKHLIEEMSSDMALVFGTAPQLPEHFRLSASGHRRDQKTFSFAAGPGWLLLDHDTDQMPVDVRERIQHLGGPLAAMEHVWPELRTACRVFKPSSSSGVYRLGDDPPAKPEGFHLYVLIQDQRQSKLILQALEARAWAEGLGWIKVSKNGSQLVRSIFDAAVGGPERLVFSGPPDLGPGVGRVTFPIEWQEGELLAAPALPKTPEWQERLAEAKQRTRPAAKKLERVWTKEQVRKSIANGSTARAAIKAAKAIKFGGVLSDDSVIDLNDGKTVRVGDLLDQGPPKGGRLSLPSPMDGIEYGRDKATLLWRAGFNPIIIDHAHGLRRRFTFARYDGGRLSSGASAKFFDVPEISAASRRDMSALLQKADSSNVRDRVIAVSKRLFWSVPAEWCLADMVSWIRSRVVHCPLPVEFWQELQNRLDQWLQARRKGVLATALLPAKTAKRHNFTYVESLIGVTTDLPSGVVLVQAPLGAGKTQHVGAPIVARAREMGLSVMAICHRVTLTHELAARLDLAHYQTATSGDAMAKGGIAVCLPSIKRAEQCFSSKYPDVVFVDEIRQVIDFLADTACFTAPGASAHEIFDYLTEVVRRARLVVGADAHLNDRTIQFLERCRPGERFTIITMPPAARSGSVAFRSGAVKNVRSEVFDAVITELVAGGKVWLACESRKLAEALDKYLRDLGFRSIAITASNKHGREQAAFLRDADTESRNFDVVVSSPAISSGISIEHRQGRHFTLGVLIGSGNAILPTDAVQQIGRVRYLERILVGVMTNNLQGQVKPSVMLNGRAAALDLQDTSLAPDAYAMLAASVEAEGLNARSDFAAALFWLLEAEGWAVTSSAAQQGSSAAEDAREAAQHEHLERLNATKLETVAAVAQALEELKEYRHGRPPMAEIPDLAELELRLEAAHIRECLGVSEILPEDYSLWNDGKLSMKIARFESLTRSKEPSAASIRAPDFWQADLELARWRLYRELFGGIDIRADGWLTPEVAERIVDKLMMQPAAFAAAGVVGQKFYSTGRGAGPRRPKSATKAVKEILGRAGLALRGEQKRVSQMGPVLVNTTGAKCDSRRVRVYSTVGFAEQADRLRLRQLRQSNRVASRQTLHWSITQLRRSLPRFSAELKVTLQRLIDRNDGHREAYE